MTWSTLLFQIARILDYSYNIVHNTYFMISRNPLIVAFILMFAIFIGCSLIKRLIRL